MRPAGRLPTLPASSWSRSTTASRRSIRTRRRWKTRSARSHGSVGGRRSWASTPPGSPSAAPAPAATSPRRRRSRCAGRRSAGAGPLAAQLLLYPVLDSRLATASIGEFGAGHLLDRAQLAFYWDAYAPLARVDRTVPLVSPAHARTLRGLPPAVIVSAEHDPLRDEAEQYAARLRQDGVRVELRRVRGQIHGFLALFQGDDEVEALLARVAGDLVRLLG